MDVRDELEALEATFPEEIRWRKLKDEATDKYSGYSVSYCQGNQTILTLNIDGEFCFPLSMKWATIFLI